MMATLIDTGIICVSILMYAFVGFIVVSLARKVLKDIMKDVHEQQRTADAIKTTEHLYHAS